MQLNSDFYDTDFEVTYKGNQILIRNDGPEGESLFVNGVLQDRNYSAHNGQLIGHIFDEDNNKEVIEIVLGGMETSDCLIYANGDLIHTNTVHEEFLKPHEEKKEKEKKRGRLFFPFLIILIITACIIIILPHMDREGSLSEPDKTVAQNNDNSDVATSAIDQKNNGAQEYIEVNYSWNYGEGTWSYDLKSLNRHMILIRL